jgi:hypothetical protein
VEIIASNETIKPFFEPFWFNSQEYISKQAGGNGTTFFYQKDPEQIFIRFYKKENELVSPLRAPFGGLEFSDATALTTLFEFIKEITAKAKTEGYNEITILAQPECYDLTKSDRIDEALIHAGFHVTVTELNYHLDPTLKNFDFSLHKSEKRRLKKCLQAGFEFSIETNPDYTLIHQLISGCRARKGHPLSMNQKDFEKMFEDFSERYILFVVKDKDKIIAVAIGVKVRSDILYNFLPADHEDYLSYSPMVLLNKGIYEYCSNHSYSVYDLGIATANGLRNEGLIKFKEHLGGILSHKYTYKIKLD